MRKVVLLILIFLFNSPSLSSSPEYLNKGIIEEKVKGFLQDYYSGQGVEVEIEFRSVPERVKLPPGEWNLRVLPWQGPRRKGNIILFLEVMAGDRPHCRFPVSLKLRTFETVLVSKRLINRHQILRENDFRWERRETTNLMEDPVKGLEEILGKRASRAIPPGRILVRRMIETPPVIRRGDIVRVKAYFKNIVVTILGRALQDGRAGDPIVVKNLDSGKKIRAVVKDSKTAIIEL